MLIQPLCLISKRLRRKCTLRLSEDSAPQSRGITKVRNSDKLNHLPLKIFIWLQTQGSQLQTNFCSIKSFYIPKKVSVVGTLDSVIHRFPSFKMHTNESRKLPINFFQTSQTTFLNQSSGTLICK